MNVDLLRYIKGVLRWWWLLLLSTALAAVTSFYVSSQQPHIYQTSTTLLVGQVTQKIDPTFQDFALSQQLAESYAQIATRQPVLQATIDALKLSIDWQSLKWQVYAAPLPRTQLLAVNVSDTSPERAVAIADEIAYQLILQSPTSPENETRRARGVFVEDQLNDLETRINGAKARIKELEANLDTALSARQIKDLQTEISDLETFVNGWQANYTELLAFLQGGESPNFLTIIEPAQLPTTPISPDTPLNVALAAAVAFFLATLAAMALEYLDDSIKTTHDIDSVLGLSVLGKIYRVNNYDPSDALVTVAEPFSAISETYRMLRTNLQFSAVDKPGRCMMVTSPDVGDGKSTLVANLAVTMAQADLRTIIVDADLRRPKQHTLFKVSNFTGLSEILCAVEPEVETVLKETGVPNLRLLTAGSLPPNPAELLGSKRTGNLIERLYSVADVVIFDSAPVLLASDSAVLSTKVDGVLLVAWANRTRLDATRESIKRLKNVGAHILGGVLNGVPERKGHYGYYYDYSFNKSGSGKNADDPASRKWWQRFWLPLKLKTTGPVRRKPERAAQKATQPGQAERYK